MVILGREISLKSKIHIECLISELSRKVDFYLASKECSSHGYLDSSDIRCYKVYLSTSFANPLIFEANAIHELLHASQLDRKYPQVYNKNSPMLQSQDRGFVEEIGSHISSFALDYDVNQWLRSNGYEEAVNHFTERNYSGMMKNSGVKYLNWKDKYNFANLAISFASVIAYADNKQTEAFITAYSAYRQIVDVAIEIKDILNRIGSDTPLKANCIACMIIDKLNLWDIHYVVFDSLKIKTAKQSQEFLKRHIPG